MGSTKKNILLTNDDGIRSPGLWAAARALSSLGFVTVAAPVDQWSGAGRSMPPHTRGTIHKEQVQVEGQTWQVFAVAGTPAQAVEHAVWEVMPARPDLVVAGINYGENIGSGVTISGTVGAALEAASLGIPSMAVSLEVDPRDHLSLADHIDFDAAAYFTALFAQRLLAGIHAADMDVLKVEVPISATNETPWQVCRLSRTRYYIPVVPAEPESDKPRRLWYRAQLDPNLEHDSDVYVLRVLKKVAVTPLSLDLTSRLNFDHLTRALHNGHHS
jgi:5'/3'-nucleotidase